jgi:SNF2 family DNA or RNA helicase
MTELFQHQKEGIEFLKDKKKALLCDSPGLGKSRQAIVAAGDSTIRNVLIVCPASLKINWEREIHMVYPEDEVEILSGSRETAPHKPTTTWTIVNYDILTKNPWILEHAKVGRFGVLILDEAHYVKDTKAQRTKAALNIAQHIEQVYCLTGTPVMNRPIELFSLLRLVKHPLAWADDKPISTLRRTYGMRYCDAFWHKLGNSGRGFWDEKGASRLPELREMIKPVFLRRTKEEVLDLPEKIVSVQQVEMATDWQRKYDTAWDAYLAWVAGQPEKDIGNILSAQALIELGKLKQVCSLAKVDRIIEDIENAMDAGEKVIVFSQYTATISEIASRINDKARKTGTFPWPIPAVTLTGQDDMENRQEAVDQFQNDPETKVFVANMKAGGVGLNLTAASIVMFADMDWSPEIHNQAMDRAHRIGQTGTVNVYYYVLGGTVEEDIIDTLLDKQGSIGVLTGGETTIKPFMERLKERVEQ